MRSHYDKEAMECCGLKLLSQPRTQKGDDIRCVKKTGVFFFRMMSLRNSSFGGRVKR